MAIWDLHCHLSGVDGKTPEERISQLLQVADRMQVDRLIFFMGFPWSNDPTPDDFRRQNDQVIQALSHHRDRALGLAYINPRFEQESLEEIDRCIARGPLVGIKLWVAVRCNDPRLDSLIRRTHELQGLIYQHTWIKSTGNLPGESTPADLVELAQRHPQVPLICGHIGSTWELAIRTIRPLPNLYGDLGGNDPTAGLVEMAVRELGAERVIYGSDIGGRSFASQLGKVFGAQIPEAARRLILGDNLKRLLTPILKAKGLPL